MNLREMADRLVDAGLPAEQAVVYVHLYVEGPQKASEVAKAASLRRPDAYRVLQALVERGFVEAALVRPTIFEAAPLERLFAQLFEEEESAWENLARAEAELGEAFRAARRSPPAGNARAFFRLLHGRPEAFRAAERLIASARETVLFVDTSRGTARGTNLARLSDLALRRCHEGLRFRGLFAGAPRVGPLPTPPGFEVRVATEPLEARFLVMDAREVVTWLVIDPSAARCAEGDVAASSDAGRFVETHLALFEHLWRAAQQAPRAPTVPAGGAARGS